MDACYLESDFAVPTQLTLAIDLKDFSLSQQIPSPEGLSLARTYLPKILDLYPEYVYRVLVINTPWLLHKIWPLFKPILPQTIISKIRIQGRNKESIKKSLREAFEPEQIPAGYGGNYLGSEGEDSCAQKMPPYGPFLPDKGTHLLEQRFVKRKSPTGIVELEIPSYVVQHH